MLRRARRAHSCSRREMIGNCFSTVRGKSSRPGSASGTADDPPGGDGKRYGVREGLSAVGRQMSATRVLRQLDRAQLDSGRRRTIEPGSCLVGAPSDSAVSQARLPYRHFAEPRSISDRLRWKILVNAHGHVHTPGAPPGCHNDSRMEAIRGRVPFRIGEIHPDNDGGVK